MGWGDLSCYLGPTRGVTTQKLDKFASEGNLYMCDRVQV
jgi:hypothetical protein